MTQKKYYPEASSNPDFPKIEENIISFWKEKGVFEKSVSERAAKQNNKNNEFVFYDGPPFANGLPHYGHLLTGFVKDIFARYQTIKGKRVERRFGWDCHGLPAEMGAEKELGISGRFEIEKFGIDKFNYACRTSVMKYTSEWEQYVTRQARWVDFKNDYKTMDKGYMESVLWAFKQLWDKGLVYESMRVMPYSWACETPLSNFETRMDNSYRERTDKAITVAFELESKPAGAPEADKYYLCAWTTTPWTLPSNLALAVNEGIEYACVVTSSSLSPIGERAGVRGQKNCDLTNNKESTSLTPHPNPLPKEGEGTSMCYVMAKSSLKSYAKELNINLEDETPAIESLKGSALVGLTYKPLFPYFASKKSEGAFKILAADFVTDEDGTGVVHLAPGFGEDDFAVCKAAGIPLVCPVDNAGKFTAEIYDLPFSSISPLGERAGVRGQRSAQLIINARDLRENSTEMEKKIWTQLRGRRFEGYKFRRQHDIGKYIVDFVCLEHKLIIELDGGQHNEQAQKSYDDERTKYLEKNGYKVLRFWNNEVNSNFEGVLETIYNGLHDLESKGSLTPHPDPLPKGGEGEERGLSLQGRNVLETNDDIIKYLKSTHAWLKTEQYKHNYPHCWRTDTPLIYKAVPSWYVEVTKFKDRMVELNQEINWIPGHVKDGQFGKWLENARDWSISRNRYWGSPIPVWKSDNPKSTQPILAFGSIKELEEFFGTKVEDLHRPFIDQLTKADDAEQPNNPRYFYKRVSDVFDCWFESGSMPYAQVHYPFENKDWFETHFPADFIVEYVAQTRGWFYTLMVLSTALFDRPPFLNVICHGVVLDDKGQKLSKRLNNYADPMDVFNKYGADAMRWVMVSAPIMNGGELLIDKEGNMVRDAVRLVLKPVWNAYNFFTLYANADGIKAEYSTASTNLMDRYILAKCRASIENISKAMDSYDTPTACRAVESFFEILNNWYIRRSKERYWKSEKDEDKQAAYDTLYTVLHIMCRTMSPLLPLLVEEIWQGLTLKEGEEVNSIHLQDFPNVSTINEDAKLISDMDRVRDICNSALAVRSSENIRVRQPLSSLTVVAQHSEDIAFYKDIIEDEINVKEVKFENNVAAFAEHKLKINFPVLGKRLPAKVKDIIAASKQNGWKQVAGTIEIAGEALLPEEFSLQLEPKNKKGAQALSSNDALVLLDLDITNELKIEGIARDLVRLIQQSRKEADLNITDRIALNVESSNSDVNEAVSNFNSYIADQTLAVSVNVGNAKSCNHNFEQKLEGENIVIGFKKVS